MRLKDSRIYLQKYVEVNLSEYLDFSDAQEQIGYTIHEVYNTKRNYSALGYLTPLEFEFTYRLTQIQATQEVSPLRTPEKVSKFMGPPKSFNRTRYRRPSKGISKSIWC